MNLRERKYINNIPKYDIGKISSGYLQNTSAPDTSSFGATPQYDMSNEVSAYLGLILPSGLSRATGYAGTIGNVLNGYTSAAKLNIDKAVELGLGKASELTEEAATKALTDAGKTVATKGVLSTAAKAASVAGALYGGYNLANDITGWSDSKTSADMMGMSSKVTQSKNGVNYTSYGGFDAQGVRDYTSALNTASTVNTVLDSAGVGSSIGSLIAPGIGTIIGGVGGALLGGIGSLFGSSSRKKKVEEAIQRTLALLNGYNTQAEAEAGSKGLRNQFYATHADKGKNITNTENRVGKVGMIHTSEGIKPGVQYGLAGKGESIYNPTNGTASVYEEGKERVDNIPTGIPLNRSEKEWNNTVIFGNKINPATGNTFAEDAKPYSKVLEKQDKDNMTLSKHTREVNRKNALNALNTLAQAQKRVTEYNCGKNRFDDGLSPTGIAGALTGIGYSLADSVAANSETPYAPNTFIPYQGYTPMRHLVDYSQHISNQRNAGRQALYNINNAGSLSGGMRAALKSQANLNNASTINSILATQRDKQNEYDKAYEDNMMRIGLTNQQYANAAASEQAKAYAQAVGAKQRLQAQARKNWYTTSRQAIQDMDTYSRYKQMTDLYNKQLSMDEQKLLNDLKKNNFDITPAPTGFKVEGLGTWDWNKGKYVE